MSRRALVIALPAALAANTLLLCAPLLAIGGAAPLAEPSVVLLMFLANLWMIAESAVTRRSAESVAVLGGDRDDKMARRLALLSGGALLLVFWMALVDRRDASMPLFCIGAGGFALGIFLRVAAARRLGRFFRTEVAVAVDQPLVTTGIYRHLRHPSEAGLLLVGLSAGVMLASPAALAAWAILLAPLSWRRIALEECCLLRAYGREYRNYSNASTRLAPGIF